MPFCEIDRKCHVLGFDPVPAFLGCVTRAAPLHSVTWVLLLLVGLTDTPRPRFPLLEMEPRASHMMSFLLLSHVPSY